MKSALIIFVRNPVLGKVKSRLAATLGNEKALTIYKALLAHTRNISFDLPVDKFIFYEDFVNQDDLWQNNIYNKFLQEGDDLGCRMKNAFQSLFEKKYEKIIIIGSDCYELSTGIIIEAYNLLSENDVVAGPASDGGYYLLGMKSFIPCLFDGKNWSSDTVYFDTVNQIKALQYKFSSLDLLNDVDVESDIDFDKLNALILSFS
ncbi:MAG TPA: TIGR04282 family arsenosugar biosynthesis glycosyltransferase [Chitinophagaceae bacterium]|nr:TIGR04282 family arsenosugar biosynthesis glycosyltransferase [Chitinophagaceae bacterium]